MRLSEIIKNSLLEGASYDSTQQTKKLRAHLVRRGWPMAVANQVSIRNQDGSYIVFYPENLSQKVHDLEYGTESRVMNPAIRDFLTNYVSSNTFASGISYSLKGMGVV